MANFAVIFNNSVQNVIVADTLADAQAVSSPHALIVEDTDNTVGIGFTYDGTTFTAPVFVTIPALQQPETTPGA